MVEQSPNHLKIEGSSPAHAAANGREKDGKMAK